ncbi:MAG: transcription elongation factor GreB [Myxococcales bacterium FL481]|nr:MAG: transcription elongation factor GreB [Myxococcales bacterium FL481]
MDTSRNVKITRPGYDKLQAEIKWLWTVERPRVTAEVEAAAALGDRSENAEYIYGKKRLREIDRRLQFLSKKMERLWVVDPGSHGRPGRADFGAFVTIEDEQGGQRTYQLVGPDEVDADAGRISIDSPVGKALLGREVDDEVDVMRPKGPTVLTVIDIAYR